MDALEWTKECAFISNATDEAKRGKIGLEFNGDLACLRRYCEMQRNTAIREAFYDSAEYIQHCIDDLVQV
jgi:hypothetical protein